MISIRQNVKHDKQIATVIRTTIQNLVNLPNNREYLTPYKSLGHRVNSLLLLINHLSQRKHWLPCLHCTKPLSRATQTGDVATTEINLSKSTRDV